MKDWYDWGVKVTSRRTAQANNGRIGLVYVQSKYLKRVMVTNVRTSGVTLTSISSRSPPGGTYSL